MSSAAKRILVQWIIGAAVLLASDAMAAPKPERIYRKILPAVMTLEIENTSGERFVGSAVLGSADDVAITAWHVVRDARTVWATFADGSRIKCSGYVDRDESRDVALIRLEKPMPGRRVGFSRQTPEIATRAYVIGAPKGFGFSISDGLLSQIREIDGVPQYQISCPISPGNSGGPILNERGRIIAIASWTKSDAQNLSFATPIREVDRLNASRPTTPWHTSGSEALPRIAGHSDPASTVVTGVADGAGFEDFSRQLQRSVGRPVTVIIQEEGTERSYHFIVPSKLDPASK